MFRWAHPVLSGKDALAWERRWLVGGEEAEWAAMRRAGRAVAHSLRRDAQECGGISPGARVLVLAGKGHNGGDALLAAGELARLLPAARFTVLPVFGERAWRPLAARAWRDLVAVGGERVEQANLRGLRERLAAEEWWDVCVDGILGLQFRLPLEADLASLLASVNEHRGFGLRVAVDLPTGVGEENAPVAFRADFTYATGILKDAALRADSAPWVGRVRYADLGFFDAVEPPFVREHVITTAALDPLRALRPAQTDKRAFGHLLVIAGSRSMPGAALMSVAAALRSGVGLVSAVVPESVAPAFAARAPEAMWTAGSETPDGGLALENLTAIRGLLDRASAVLLGPGMGRERETLALVQGVLSLGECPVILDADALQRQIVETFGTKRSRPVVITPHAGEFARLRGVTAAPVANAELIDFALERGVTAVLKGPVTRVSDGQGVWHSPFGGPVLARGGSGDVLAGLMAGRIAAGAGAETPLLERVVQGLAWHGHAADHLARAQGATAAVATDLLAHLAPALRETWVT